SKASATLTTVSAGAVESTNEFALKFYLANSKECKGNLCVSPFSVGSVLGMLANGNDGEARNEILTLLGFDASKEGLDALNTHYQTLLSNFPNIEEEITCNFTNTIWCDPLDGPIYEPFMQTISDKFYATYIPQTPKGDQGQYAINQFVSKNTNGLIENFLSKPLDVEYAFLNTSLFKAGWNESFIKELTKTDEFHDMNNKKQKIDFMTSVSYSRYTQYTKINDGTESVRLYYGKDAQFSMTLILPAENKKNKAPEEVLTVDNIRQINEGLKHIYIEIKLPKFEVELNNAKTIDILKKIGLEKVCSGIAGFNKIKEDDTLYLGTFVHAAKLKVDEDGTEAAAASLGGLEYGAPLFPTNTPKIPQIVFDRPFIFYIQENITGSILFIGSVKTFA
ncbi:MAG: hypothetical protein K2G13_02280, partial [Muribaculaceae bacterium]|nr:hypothetical protein [Muribaculaceae bacterium]